jgi:hypothetical protein
MQDFLIISFFLGHDRGEAARQLLTQCDLLEEATSAPANRHAWLGALHLGVQLRLRSEDPRLKHLLDGLDERQIEPFTRVERHYSNRDLISAEWLVLRIATAGLYGGADVGQDYDFTSACITCGSGAVPKPPLIAELGSMGKKDVDHLVYEGHMIVSNHIANNISDLTGVIRTPVKSPRRPTDDKFSWLRISGSLPQMHPTTTGYRVENPCPSCGRSGYYGNAMNEPESPVYEKLPATATDFNLTWEYFGSWKPRRSESQERLIGGSRGVVVSQRVRQRLLELKVRRLVWIPVRIVE